MTPDTVVRWHRRGFAPRAPGQNPFVERVIGSLRREYLDHVIAWNKRSMRRHLRQYLVYDHEWRTRLSLDKDAPFRGPSAVARGANDIEVDFDEKTRKAAEKMAAPWFVTTPWHFMDGSYEGIHVAASGMASACADPRRSGMAEAV